ncbi:hypothetical protein [Oceanospirillum sp.]|uniref:hypothetical protein n=1 Tax=Oceanospirillum sp. TaxID=2021254 RepID=UPI003A92EBC6
MSQYVTQRQMLIQVAEALGSDLRKEVAFVGGCTTALFVTDEVTLENIRSTDDVDLIIHVIGYSGFNQLQRQLQVNGFRNAMPEPGDEDEPICAMKLGQLRVDFMPDDEAVLGFTNRWYRNALEHAEDHRLNDDVVIRLVDPVYFVATKLEAWKGRGGGDTLGSRDLEDILNVVDGRPELTDEIHQGPEDVRAYIAEEFRTLLENSMFEYAVSSQADGSDERENILYQRIEEMAGV